MGEPTRKIKPLSIVCFALAAILAAATVFFMFFSDAGGKSNEQTEAVNIFDATAQDESVFLDVQYMTEAVAYLEAVDMQYYITFDSEWNPAVICMYDSELEKLQPYIDWMYTEEEEGGPEEMQVTGYSVPFDEELKQYVIDGCNATFGMEILSEQNFEEWFGSYYLTIGKNSGNYETFNIGIYCLLGAVIFIVLGVAVSYNSLKEISVAGADNYLEVRKIHKGRGIVGAFLGALLGAVLWTAVGALGYISGWIGVLMVLFATTGYKLFAKEESRIGTIIAVVFSLILVLPATYLAAVWNFYQELNKSMSEYVTLVRAFQNFSAYLTKVDGWGDMIYNIGMGYIFMVVAGCYSIGGVNKRKQREASNVATHANVNLPGQDEEHGI